MKCEGENESSDIQCAEIGLRDLAAFLWRKKIFFLLFFSVIFSTSFFFKVKNSPLYLLEQGVFLRNEEGRVLDSHYIYNLRKFFLTSQWFQEKIHPHLAEMGLKEDPKIDIKIVPFAGIKASASQFEHGYIFALRVYAYSISQGEEILKRLSTAYKNEIQRFNSQVGLNLKVYEAESPKVVLTPQTAIWESAVSSVLVSVLVSCILLLLIQWKEKNSHSR